MTPTEIAAALRQVQEALIDLGACNNPDCTEPNCNRALSQLPTVIAAVEEQQNTVAGLREDLRQLIRVVLTNPADAAGFIQANYPRESAEFTPPAQPDVEAQLSNPAVAPSWEIFYDTTADATTKFNLNFLADYGLPADVQEKITDEILKQLKATGDAHALPRHRLDSL